MLTALGLCALGLTVLVIGAELVVRGGIRVAAWLGVSPLVIGLTVVAIGTSTPELAVGVAAALEGNGGLAVGNIAGTNSVNLLLILGLSAALLPLDLRAQTVRYDLPAMLAAAVAFLVVSWDGTITRLEGLLLLLGGAFYTAGIIAISRYARQSIMAEYAEEFGAERKNGAAPLRNVLLLVAGIAIIVLGADWLVDGAVALARLWQVSDAFIGLTIVAIGTSSPELVTTIVCTLRKDRDIAVGNLIGSSVYNILVILGITCLAPSGGVAVSDTLLHIDIPVMMGVAALCLPVFVTGRRITRVEGALFVALYCAYLAYLVIART